MLFGCCTSFGNFDLLVKHGYDRIILPATELMAMDNDTVSHVRKTLIGGPVQCLALNSFCTPSLVLCGKDYLPTAVESYSASLAVRAHRLGVRYIGVGAPKSRSIPDGFFKDLATEQLCKSLDILCTACTPYNITVLLEAVCSLECNFITTTDEAVAIVKKLDRDNLALVFDTYHAFMMGEDHEPLRRALSNVKLIHVAQNIDNSCHYLRRENFSEYRVYFDALLEGGYDGEVSVQAFCGNIAAQLDDTLSIMKSLCLR